MLVNNSDTLSTYVANIIVCHLTDDVTSVHEH